MAENDISISEMTNGTFTSGALFPAISPNQGGTGYYNVKMSGADIGDGIGQLQFPLRLETENKSIFGAINEAAKSVINFLPIDTASGAMASFPDGANNIPCPSVLCTINPVQSGSGDPSPSNIRPITGHTQLNLVQKDGNDTVVHTYTTDLGTTVYGGTLEVETGVLTKKYEKYKLGSSGWVESSGRYQHRYEGIMKSGSYYSDKGAICDTYPKLETLASGTGLVFGYNSDYLYFYVKDDFPTLADWTTYLENNDVYVTMPLATPTTIQLTPQEVKSLLGSNNIYHDCNGQVAVTYRADIGLYIAKKTA